MTKYEIKVDYPGLKELAIEAKLDEVDTEELMKLARGDEDDIFESLYDALYTYFVCECSPSPMPYGTQKGRTGDPYEWIFDYIGSNFTEVVYEK